MWIAGADKWIADKWIDDSHMVSIAPLALATWTTWVILDTLPVLRIQMLFPKTCTLVRSLQDQTTQVIGACALMNEGYLRAPYPDGMDSTPSYVEFLADIDNFAVMVEGRLHLVCASMMSTVGRHVNAVVEMFHSLGTILQDDWVKKMADVAAEPSYRCRLYPTAPGSGTGDAVRALVPRPLVPVGARPLAHPVVEDDSDDSFHISSPEPEDS